MLLFGRIFFILSGNKLQKAIPRRKKIVAVHKPALETLKSGLAMIPPVAAKRRTSGPWPCGQVLTPSGIIAKPDSLTGEMPAYVRLQKISNSFFLAWFKK
jgi:hypothetical protein